MDLFDLDLGVGLSVAADGLAVLLGAVLEDSDLLALAVLQNLGLDRSALHNGSAELGVRAVHNCQNLIEGNEAAIAHYKKLIRDLESQNAGARQMISAISTDKQMADDNVREKVEILIGRQRF